MLQALANIGAAFGLSSSAGLNAYIPLLLVALAARFPLNNPLVSLQEPYAVLGSWWSIGIIAVLLIIEMLVDKVPAVDTINDGIQTFVRPAAGAILFAANANVVNDIHPVLALTAGLLVAGSVHAAKGVTRPVVTAATAGTGNWFVSTMEDGIAFVMSILALLMPLLALTAVILFALFVFRLLNRRRQKRVTT